MGLFNHLMNRLFRRAPQASKEGLGEQNLFDLQELAARRGIKGYGQMSKMELIQALESERVKRADQSA